MSGLKRTPLFSCYRQFPGARCIDFGGWELPVQFSGIVEEHEAVRERAGLFDVSHMGELFVTGPDAEMFLQRVTVNDVARLSPGQVQYSLLCDPEGGVVDDLLVYKLSRERYMLVVNASNIEKDIQWLKDHLFGDAVLHDRSDEMALLALQGPLSAKLLSQVTDAPVSELASFHFIEKAQVCGVVVLISRTGYTGEDGFELYVQTRDAPGLWQGLLEAGAADGLVPAGLGARDTLRFEARLPLYGQELSPNITPLEAGLGFFVHLNKGDFVGREALLRQQREGVPRKLVGIEMVDRGIPRAHYPVYAEADGEEPIGEVTTGTHSPTLKRNVGLALLKQAYAQPDAGVWVEIRGKRLLARIVKTPFYKRKRRSDAE